MKKKLSIILACVVSICCLNIGAVAAETQWDNNIIEITQGTMRATKTFEATMNIQAGTTTPSFFINDEKIFGVCQDANAVSYIYEFSESSDGLWILINTQQQQDAGRYEEICQSFDAYQATR